MLTTTNAVPKAMNKASKGDPTSCNPTFKSTGDTPQQKAVPRAASTPFNKAPGAILSSPISDTLAVPDIIIPVAISDTATIKERVKGSPNKRTPIKAAITILHAVIGTARLAPMSWIPMQYNHRPRRKCVPPANIRSPSPNQETVRSEATPPDINSQRPTTKNPENIDIAIGL
jgi:hypothetical protein